MPRTTDADVKAIDRAIPAAASLTAFIRPANILVTRHCVRESGEAGYMTEDELKEVETWLAAHFYHQDKRRRESIALAKGAVSEKTKSSIDLGFDNDEYGQMAMRLDATGALSALNAQAKASSGANVNSQKVGMVWLGTDRDAYGTER
jgi:hypothetical protein